MNPIAAQMTDADLGELIVQLLEACSGPINLDQIERLVAWACGIRADSALLRLVCDGRIEIVVEENGKLPANLEDLAFRKRKDVTP